MEQIEIYTLENEALGVSVSNAGASVLSLELKEDGRPPCDVLLGTPDPGSRLLPGPMFGATLGRTAGKTMPPAYRCQGKEIRLEPNRQTYHCHGGFKGFDKQIYEAKQESAASITMCRMSPDGEGGYPGNLQVEIRFSLEHRALCIEYMAKSDEDTVVSISNHLYFNLNGQGNGDVLGHPVRIPSGRVLHIDGQGVSDGGIRQTAGTPFDFIRPCRIGEQMAKEDEQLRFAGGFDHTYLREVSAAEPVLEAWGDRSDIRMRVYTDLPAIQFYVADFEGTGIIGKGGRPYRGRDGFCVEPLFPPNAMNTDLLPKPVLKAGDTWRYTVKYAFDIGNEG